MSAIWGIIELNSNQINHNDISGFFENEYKKRCKIDKYSHFIKDNVYFGSGLQYITSESKYESLPIYDESEGILFSADCILDNRDELIGLLEGCNLAQKPDGMLMYLAYLAYGIDCVKHFRGLFSIAIWDFNNGTLTLISDQVSARCLYYVKTDKYIAFSTLMSPLCKYDSTLSFNQNYFKDFLLAENETIYMVPGETPYKGVNIMLPATYVKISRDFLVQKRYWDCYHNLGKQGFAKKSSIKEIGDKFMSIYNACVSDALRVVPSGEIGLAMSSGLDSSSIGALAAPVLKQHGKRLKTYTFTPHEKFEHTQLGNNIYDESSLVSEIAKLCENMDTTFLDNDGKNIFEDMELCSWILEMPYKTGTFPNHLDLCRHGESDGCKVFLNGGYGNNTVSYGHINNILYDLYNRKNFIALIRYANNYAKHEKLSRLHLIKHCIKNFATCNIACRSQKKTTFLDNFVPENVFLSQKILNNYNLKERFLCNRRMIMSRKFVDSKQYPDFLDSTGLFIYLGIFETKFGLYTNMLLRDPTKDIRLLSFCSELPYNVFAYNGKTRWLIRHNFKDLLPSSILDKWQQFGYLNADWVIRVERDWDKLYPELLKILDCKEINEYLLATPLKNYLDRIDFTDKRDRKWITHICALYGLRQYIQGTTKF
jgi:asparagine synthase (glutamine-hydrolysing)